MHTLVPAAVSANFSNGLAAIIFILAVYGMLNLFGLADERSFWRLGVIILVIGVFFANLPLIGSLGQSLRTAINDLLTRFGLPEFTSDLVLLVILVLLIMFFFTKHQKSRPGDNKWMWFTLAGVVVLMTVSLVSTATLWITQYAARALGWLQNANF